jgi:hypothetical protein
MPRRAGQRPLKAISVPYAINVHLQPFFSDRFISCIARLVVYFFELIFEKRELLTSQFCFFPMVSVIDSGQHFIILKQKRNTAPKLVIPNYFLVVLYKMADSDSESIGTEDIIEPELEPEEIEEPEPQPEPAPVPEPVLKNDPPVKVLKKRDAAPPKKRGRKPNVPVEPIKTEKTMSNYSKAELVALLHSQQTIIDEAAKKEANEITKSKEHLESKLKNKVKAGKKPRTAAQIAATERLVARNKKAAEDKREGTKKEVKKELKDQLDLEIESIVQNEVVRIIQAPLRTLTPERMRKVKDIEDLPRKYKNKF